jgi:hypothetical protein
LLGQFGRCRRRGWTRHAAGILVAIVGSAIPDSCRGATAIGDGETRDPRKLL